MALENLLRERGKNAYADAVAHAGGMPVDFRYQANLPMNDGRM